MVQELNDNVVLAIDSMLGLMFRHRTTSIQNLTPYKIVLALLGHLSTEEKASINLYTTKFAEPSMDYWRLKAKLQAKNRSDNPND